MKLPPLIARRLRTRDNISDLLENGLIRDSDTIHADKLPDGRYQLKLANTSGGNPGVSKIRSLKTWRSGVRYSPKFMAGAMSRIGALHKILRAGLVIGTDEIAVERLHDGSVRLHVRAAFLALAFPIPASLFTILMEDSGDILMETSGSILMEA